MSKSKGTVNFIMVSTEDLGNHRIKSVPVKKGWLKALNKGLLAAGQPTIEPAPISA